MGKRLVTKSRSQTIEAPHLSATDIRRLPKPRAGFVQFAQEAIALLKARADVVVVNGIDPDAMLTALQAYAAAMQDVSKKKSAYVTAADALLVLGSTIWGQTLVAYQHLKVAARTDGGLQTAIEPLEAFMKKRGSRKKAKTSTPSAPSTPVAA
jgi:transcriptional regulator with AAA-type ATPase domain